MFDTTTVLREESIMSGDYSEDITSVVIPAKIKVIGTGAFSKCKYLSKVTFEKGSQLEVIKDFAFCGCERLKSIIIPKNVKEINRSFDKALESITFESGSQLEVIGECAFRDTSIKKICIPRTVMKISDQAFYFRNRNCEVSFESGSCLEHIGERAFYNCNLTKKLQLPSTLTFMGERAFESSITGTLDLSKLTSLSSLPKSAFAGCWIKKVIMPKSRCIEVIEEDAFKKNDFKSFDFNGIKVIKAGAFTDCKSLKKALIPTDCKLETSAPYEKVFEKSCVIERKD